MRSAAVEGMAGSVMGGFAIILASCVMGLCPLRINRAAAGLMRTSPEHLVRIWCVFALSYVLCSARICKVPF